MKPAAAAKAAAAAGRQAAASSHGRLQRPTAVPEDTEAAMPAAGGKPAPARGDEAAGGVTSKSGSSRELGANKSTGNCSAPSAEEDKVGSIRETYSAHMRCA